MPKQIVGVIAAMIVFTGISAPAQGPFCAIGSLEGGRPEWRPSGAGEALQRQTGSL
jgi:hypothetical protein